ncbi:hypothetical protein sos41_05440 [Alphaproteobacteria bacterium SO-S41]|nr:hypothetical protein sos41_05440 [Alphaproteobacteria bacterium SO-S41]
MSRQLIATLAGLAVAFAVTFGINFGLAAAGVHSDTTYWWLGVSFGSLTTITMLNMSGNKKVATADRGARSDALAFAPPAGQGLLVVYREGFMGKAIGADVSVDGRDVAQLKSPRFTAIALPPGSHVLKAQLAGSMNAGSTPGETAFDLAAGAAVVFRITLKMKMTTSDVVLTRIDDLALAKKKMAGMTMIASEAA